MPQPMIQRSTPAQEPIRVLVVDDREDVALGPALLLRQLGYSVQVANDAKEALAKGAAFQPDLVFLDIGLPDLSGYDVCKEMRGSDRGANFFIVALTGRNEAADVIHSAHAGFDRHVGKPMDLATLQEILRAVKIRAVR